MDPSAYGPDAHKSMSFLAMDDPKHMRIRKLVSKGGFTPRRVNDLTGRITALTHQHWSKCLDMGEFDYVHDFAALLPMDVVSELLGVPPEADRTHLRHQSDLLLHREDGVLDIPPEAAIYAYIELHKYYSELIADRRKNPGEDLVSALIEAEIDDDETGEKIKLTEDEIVGFMVLMVVAGNETTTKLLANALYWGGWRNPDELGKVFADPRARGTAVDRGDASLRQLDPDRRSSRDRGRSLRRPGDSRRRPRSAPRRFGEPRRRGLRAGRRQVRHRPGQRASTDEFRPRCALLSRCTSRPAGGNIGLGEVIRSIRAVDIDIDKAVRVHSVNVRGFAELPVKVTVR